MFPAIGGTQTGIAVTAAAARRFTVAGFPSPATAGTAGNFTVTVWDAYSNRVDGYTGTVRFTSSDARAVLPGDYTFTPADAGTHAFGATLKTAGTQSLTVTDTANGAITGAQGGILVSPPRPAVTISDVNMKEGRNGNTLFVFTVTLSAPSAVPVTVRYATADGTATAGQDYQAASGTLTFAPGKPPRPSRSPLRGIRRRRRTRRSHSS